MNIEDLFNEEESTEDAKEEKNPYIRKRKKPVSKMSSEEKAEEMQEMKEEIQKAVRKLKKKKPSKPKEKRDFDITSFLGEE